MNENEALPDQMIIFTTRAEVSAVNEAIWHQLRFLKRFSTPSPTQIATARLLESFLKRLPEHSVLEDPEPNL